MTHLDDLLNYWDRLSKGESPTTKQVREARDKDEKERAIQERSKSETGS